MTGPKMQNELNIVISAGNSLCKWLNIELPRMPSPDGKRIGTQPLQNSDNTQYWQCQAVQLGGNTSTLVIAVEAHSRFSIILPFDWTPTVDEFEEAFLSHMMKSLIGLLLFHGIVNPDANLSTIDRILGSVNDISWFRNTDLSVNGHVKDTEEWILAYQEDFNKIELDEEDLAKLEAHVNDLVKKVKTGPKSKDSFIPVPRFIDDAIKRFDLLGQTQPDNASTAKSKPEKKPAPSQQDLPDNVVSIADYRKD